MPGAPPLAATVLLKGEEMHPISYDIAFELERNRLTVFFRFLLAIPWILVLYLYALAAYIAALIAWFAILFTKRYPEGLYSFVAGFVRYIGRLGGWIGLATDSFPPFNGDPDPDYPVRVDIGPRQAEYSRAKTFFKLVLYFPQALIGYGAQMVVGAAAFVTWWRVLFTGRQSATMHDGLRLGLAYYLRSTGFLLLLTEVHPRLLDLPAQSYPAGTPGLPLAVEAPA